jgi:hypothetical protein
MPKGLYTPKLPQKYIGDVSKIRFMSSWELRFFRFCDGNPHIVRWASEEIAIPYYNPVKQRMANYYPDIYMEVLKPGDTTPTKMLVEIKPNKDFQLTNKSTTYDKVMMVINEAKWKSAKAFCDQHGIIFKVVSETNLFRV